MMPICRMHAQRMRAQRARDTTLDNEKATTGTTWEQDA